MKFEENWPKGFKGEVVQMCGRMTDDDGGQVITITHLKPSALVSQNANRSTRVDIKAGFISLFGKRQLVALHFFGLWLVYCQSWFVCSSSWYHW